MSVETRTPLVLRETETEHETRLTRDATLTGVAVGLNLTVAGLGGVMIAEGEPILGLGLVVLSARTLDNMDKDGALDSFKFWKRGL